MRPAVRSGLVIFGVLIVAGIILAATALVGRGEGGGSAHAVGCTGRAAVDFRCYERRYVSLVERRGPRAALRALDAQQRRNGYVRAACHQLTHRIGRAAGDLRGLAALDEGLSVCVSGYYHGVLQSVMGRQGSRDAVADAQATCVGPRARQPRSALHYNCVHGMGHGFMEVYAKDVLRSLRACGVLEDRWERDECAGGVFMENVSAIDDGRRPSRDLRPERPLYPCTEVARRLWEQCYDWQVTYALYVTHSDFAKVFALCASGPPASRGPCYRGLGGDALQQSKFVTGASARQATIRRLCALGPEAGARAACVTGAVRNMYRDYVDGDVQARALCRSLEAAGDRELQAVCGAAEAWARRHVALPEAGAA